MLANHRTHVLSPRDAAEGSPVSGLPHSQSSSHVTTFLCDLSTRLAPFSALFEPLSAFDVVFLEEMASRLGRLPCDETGM